MKKNIPVLVLLRGAPATGKTTIARYIRSKKRKFVWISIDALRVFVYKYPPKRKDLIFKATLALTNFFLREGFSVIVEELFIRLHEIERFYDLGKENHLPVYLFELTADLEDIIKRNPQRPFPLRGGAKEAMNLYKLLEKNP